MKLCHRCQKALEEIVFLEKNEKTQGFYCWGSVPDTDSGGFHPFCSDCARQAILEGRLKAHD